MKLRLTLPVALLALTLGCSGGSGESSASGTPAAPPTFSYTDPSTGVYRLVKNTSLSTPGHLVLDLKATDTASGSGLAFSLSLESPSRATWTRVTQSDPSLIQNGGVFPSGGSLVLSAKAAGASLAGVVGLKGQATAPSLNGVLARVALEVAPQASAGPCALTPTKVQVLLPDGSMTSPVISVGNLSLQ